MDILIRKNQLTVGLHYTHFKTSFRDKLHEIYQKLKVENVRYRIIYFFHQLKPTTGKGDTAELGAFFGSSETQTETRDKSNDLMINGYTETNSYLIELNLFGRYKVRKISSS